MADGDAPTKEQRQECEIRMLKRRIAGQATELRRQNLLLVERKRQLDTLGIAWSTRGAASREGQLTKEEVDRLIVTVNRIQYRHFNTEYRILYASLDEMLRKRCESLMNSWVEACGQKMVYYRWAKRWKALAKKQRRTSPDRSNDRG